MLSVKNLSIKYNSSDKTFALHDINFSIQTGERVALTGANGAGKSTLLLGLCGVLMPSSGEILIKNILLDKKNLNELRRELGMIFQNPDEQLFMPTIYDDIAFGPRNYGLPEDEIRIKMENILEQLGITRLKDRMSHKMSGGEKRLAALAGVLMTDPSVLLMDEPSSFLDPKARRRMINILNELPQTMIIATHDLDMALDLCSRVILLKEGSVYADAPAQDILSDSSLLDECGLELPLSLYKQFK